MGNVDTTIRAFVAAACLLLSAPPLHAQVAREKAPRLILQITVDQLRGDLPASVIDRCGQGGFRYLCEKGVVYENAHHRPANTDLDQFFI